MLFERFDTGVRLHVGGGTGVVAVRLERDVRQSVVAHVDSLQQFLRRGVERHGILGRDEAGHKQEESRDETGTNRALSIEH